jgi:plasmid stability protein
MAQLIVRKLNDRLVKRLKRRAAEHGVSAEEEHRRLLREALEPEKKPNVGDDDDFKIDRVGKMRDLDLSD